MNKTTIIIHRPSDRCVATTLLLSDFYNIAISTFRILSFLLNFLWLILAISIKEFHKPQMAFLFNLNAIGIFYCFIGVASFFWSTCHHYRLHMCYVYTFNGLFAATLSGYGLSAFAMHRLACYYFLRIETTFTKKLIAFFIISTWILPAVFSLIQLFAFDTNINELRAYNICVIESKSLNAFIFFAFFNTILPNVLLITACVLLAVKIKKRTKPNSRTPIERPKLTAQLIIYVVMFEVSCIANLIIFYETVLRRHIISANGLNVMRMLKWLHHFCPLALLFFHPVMMKKYKRQLKLIK